MPSANQRRAALTATFGRAIGSEFWIASFLRGVMIEIEEQGLEAIARDPARVRELLDAEIEQLGIDLGYARKLARLYPEQLQGGNAA